MSDFNWDSIPKPVRDRAIDFLEKFVGMPDAEKKAVVTQILTELIDRTFHASRWHATYNAALTALLQVIPSSPPIEGLEARRNVHGACCEAANRAHGPLVTP